MIITELPYTDVLYERILDTLSGYPGVQGCYPFGSRHTSQNTTYEDTDVLLWGDERTLVHMEDKGFDVGDVGEEYARRNIRSYRKGPVNIIFVWTKREFLQRAAATELCRAQSVQGKKDRADIHELIRS